MTHRTMSERSTSELHPAPQKKKTRLQIYIEKLLLCSQIKKMVVTL